MKTLINIRPYRSDDYPSIKQLNQMEGWSNLVEKEEDTKKAWDHSNIAYVVTMEEEIVAYVRGITDQAITLYICEILVSEKLRGQGVGQQLLKFVHNQYPTTRMEMLASSTSHTYYEQHGFRPFFGFRKTLPEWK
ncbi:GNAT family N-acetyltransferase [Paenisporosarcina quisquiliarum]|uniref:GNAT family N-acetyltransferase n=1 Tax=Paenisporosarcina quisquiliarum TaxID=365346 RepID=A0A9X3LF74_9BACL|nr:GNAT family N-acetyltransferase [Paenisporosarcina quisquiliarum]MCZ8536872.1 GNAT family N-acetyltransferase [Paenisporosarcina quisquiliarum]